MTVTLPTSKFFKIVIAPIQQTDGIFGFVRLLFFVFLNKFSIYA